MSETTETGGGPSAVGRYRIEGTLGFGAMGAVYRAFDPIIKRTLAIKTIRVDVPPNSPQHKAFTDRFYQEARISGTLSHPGIVTLFDVGEEKGVPFLAMEYVEGRTISAMIDAGETFKPERVLGLVSQVAAALDYAHSRGIVHRDIKPSNLIVQAGDRVKVTDFGIAKLVDSDITQSGALLGTPSYMSPEQAMGEKLDGRSDIFSLGVVAFEMLSGQQPFPGANVTSILYRLVHVDPIEPADLEMSGLVPQKWREVFHKVLAKKPEDRYATASEFVRDLEFCLGSWFTGLGEETVAVDAADLQGAGAGSASEGRSRGGRDDQSRETVVLPAPDDGLGADAAADEADVHADGFATVQFESSSAAPPPGEEETVLLRGPGASPGESGAARSAAGPLPTVTEPVELTEPERARRPMPVGWLVAGAALLFFLAALSVTWALWQRAAAATSASRDTVEGTAPAPPTAGVIRVESEPAGGRVSLDDEAKGEAPLEIADVGFGSHEVRVELPGYVDQVRQVTLDAGRPREDVAVTLSRPAPAARAPARGTADFSSTPPGATVTVGGRRLGTTPLRGVALDPGRHRVEMSLDGHEPWSGTVDVEAGRGARAAATLVPVGEARPAPTPAPVDTARLYENSKGSVDTLARRTSGLSPRYPSDRGAPRLRSGERVSVTLSFVVTAAGEVEDVKVVESAGALVDAVVVDAVKSWQYEPATIRGTPVRVRIVHRQTFLGG
jgi:TonB family protein